MEDHKEVSDSGQLSGESTTRTNKPINISRGLITLTLVAVVLIGLNSLRREQTAQAPTAEDTGASVPSAQVTPEAKDRQITLEEISLHNKKDDCWLAIDGKVYDVTPSSNGNHPGGDAILEGCGKDASVLFSTRPMGSKTPHSQKARDFLANFLIGVLAS